MYGKNLLFITLLLSWTSSILGDEIFNNEESNFWLSSENISNLLNYSFPESRCCNVHIAHDMNKKDRLLLKSFISIYQNEYFLNERSDDCTDNLFINVQDNLIIKYIKRIPIVSKTRILILINSKVEENSTLFNTSMYKNSFANLVCQNGIHTLLINSSGYYFFKKVDSYEEIKRSTKIIDLQGKQLQVSTFYNPPFSYLKRTINRTIKGTPAKIFLTDQKKKMDGIELQLFLLIAKTLNFKYTFRAPSGGYNHGRRYNRTAWDGGMIGQIARKEVDIAFGDIWLILDNLEFVSLSEPWTQVFIKFLVPRPQPFTSFWALTRPFTPLVWSILGVILALVSGYVYCKARIDPLMPKRFTSLVATISEMTGRMLGWTWISPVAPQVRLQFVLWELAGFLIVTLYCSSLASKLTYPQFEDRIDTLEQFVKKNLTWGRMHAPPVFKEYFNLKDNYAKQMPDRFILEQSVEDRSSRVFQRNHAVVGRIVGNVFFPEGEISDEALWELRVMDQIAGQFYTCFAVQPWLLDSVNKVMLRLRESGIVAYHMKHVIYRRAGFHLYGVFIEHDKPEEDVAIVLSINPLGAGFATLIFGLIAACLVFYKEWRNFNKRNNLKLFEFYQFFKNE